MEETVHTLIPLKNLLKNNHASHDIGLLGNLLQAYFVFEKDLVRHLLGNIFKDDPNIFSWVTCLNLKDGHGTMV
ncbi:hypothetical protein M8C21_011527 [Ambrosia artemisiifolia]|uniref:Uncharacterized protein n=1 Tax=Ambrosia artemisiifolia TaxID=4212 RepID=A0AAD5BXD4_AMBAR|nr:hypothetical protein M8C21_011527 [Ambrosia artemisiifolia]